MYLEDIIKNMEDVRAKMSASAFQQLETVLNESINNIREEIQGITSEQIEKIIKKLKDNKSITVDEQAVIELWIIGDAESYTKMENNFQDWLEELKRLEVVLKDYKLKEHTLNDLFKLHGIFEDAIRLTVDITNFLDNEERINRFKTAIKSISNLEKKDRNMLINILSEKLLSPNY